MKTARTLDDVNVLTSKRDIFDLEEAYMQSVGSKPRDNRQGYFHPSAVGMCGRRNVYEYIRTPAIQTIDPNDLEIYDMGHGVHDIIQRKLHDLDRALTPRGIKYEFQDEVRYDPKTDRLMEDFGIGGTCDGILRIWSPEEGWEQRGIVEIKSINDKGYHKLSGPKEEHLMQTHIYAYRFNCPLMWIWYFNKNTSKRRVFPVIFDQEILMAALRRYEGWLSHIDNGTIPDREESWYMCPRCEYRKECKPPTLRKVGAKARAKKESAGRKKGRLHRVTTRRDG